MLVAASCGLGGSAGGDSAPAEAPAADALTAEAPAAGGDSAGAEAPVGEAAPSAVQDPADAAAAATIAWVECPSDLASLHLTCALASVPVDWDDPSGPVTQISLTVLRGSDPDPGRPPLAVLEGGPGTPSTESNLYSEIQPYPQVFIDQRGTGFGSTDFDCTELDQIPVEALAGDGDEAARLLDSAYEGCWRRLSAHPVLENTNSVAHAADAAAVMAGLGHDRWFVYGASYGTTIALEVMRADPPGLAGAVLDGVYPPGLDVDQSLGSSARSALRELDAACAEDPVCRGVLADVDGTLDELVARFNDRPLTATVDPSWTGLEHDLDVEINGDDLANMVFWYLYDPWTIVNVPWLLAGIDRGDQDAVDWLAQDSYGYDFYGAEGTFQAVECSERLAMASGAPDGVGEYEEAIARPGLAETCAGWDLAPSPSEPPPASDLPVLLLAGRFDPITSPEMALRTAEGLPNSTVVIHNRASHGVWTVDFCAARIVDAFLSDPAASLDSSCAAMTRLIWTRP